ncbi:MAG: VOC family protein [Gammaproteobacteria bacterium]|jgi:predicted enzyme related to lactoylglutathione lyase
MNTVIPDPQPARFRWLDLAAVDARKAADFYLGMFGWDTQREAANGGEFLRFAHAGEVLASLYQLGPRQIAGGVPSHWTPYIGVNDVGAMAARAAKLGGQVVVKPFDVDGMARVSLVTDSTGALLGLWELSQ